MNTSTLTLASAIAVPALIAAVIYYLTSKNRVFQPTIFSKIVIGFYIISAIVNISADFYFYFADTYPGPIPDYRLETIINAVPIFVVFTLPVFMRKSQYFAYSFYYILTNLIFFMVFGALVTGIISAEQLLIAAIKFIVVLCALMQSLKKIDEPRP